MDRREFVRLTATATLASIVVPKVLSTVNALSQLTNASVQPRRRYIPQAYIVNFPTAPTRLLAKVEDFEHVWQVIQTYGKAGSLYEQLKSNAEGILQQPPPTYQLCGSSCKESKPTLEVSRVILDHIYTLGMIYRLEGDKRYFDRAWADLEPAAQFPDWNPQNSFLNTAEMTHAFAIGYDWFPWTEAQRAVLRDAIVEKGLKPALAAYRDGGQSGFSWWVKSPSGWNQVCNGGIGMGTLALLPELPELCQQILDYAVKSLQESMGTFAPDGGWPEGPNYWDYATFYSCVFLAALETAVGKDFSLFKTPGFSDTGLFAIYVTGPKVRTFNFADSGDTEGRGLKAYQMLWLAREFQRSVDSWYPQDLTSSLNDVHALSLLWFDPEERDPKSEGLPLDKYLRGVEVATFRTGWNDGNAIFVGFKAGDNKANHSHLDVGTFVLDALGERWALDLGPDDYSLPGYLDEKGRRWTYYRTRAEGHNTLVLDPSNEPDQDPRAAAKITRFVSEPAKALAIADLTPAYYQSSKGSLEKLERGIALLNRTTVVVQDEIIESQSSELWWFMHTRASVQLAGNGSTATLELGPSRLWCAVASPADAEFSLMDAKQLPSSPDPSGQASNASIRKLAIHLRNIGSTRLSVVMVPLSLGQTPPTRLSSPIPLSEW